MASNSDEAATERTTLSKPPDLANEPMHLQWYRLARRVLLRMKRPWVARKLRRVVTEEIDGVRLIIPPGVHNPVIFRSGVFLARVAASLPIEPNARVADVGTGSGIAAIFAARRGWRVFATDINPVAVRCARANVNTNGVSGNTTILEGDLLEPVAGDTFDLVLFNPPFFVGQPENMADMAWRSVDTLQRFATQLPDILSDNGRALVVFSSDGDEAALKEAFAGSPLHIEPFAWKDLGNEVLTVYSISRSYRSQSA